MRPGGHASNGGAGSSSGGERIASVREKIRWPQRQLRQPFSLSNFPPPPPLPPPSHNPHSVHTRSQVLTDTKGTCKVSEDAVAASERQNSTGGKGVSTPSPAGLHKAIESAPKDVTKTEQAEQSTSERTLNKSVRKAASVPVRARAKRCAREASANEEPPHCA